MADLDDLFNQIPVQEIAGRLNADENEVNNAVRTLVPVLVGGLQHNAADPGAASGIASAANNHAGLLDGGVSVDQVDEADGAKAVAKIFDGNDNSQVASALAGGGAGNSDLIQRLLPILAPIVLAYIGKQLTGGTGSGSAASGGGGGGLGDILGGILGGGAGGGGSLGDILGSVLGGDKGGGLGDILGGLLGGRK
ncbi:DUF937 domain-containing protein [Mycolicibacterium phlei]